MESTRFDELARSLAATPTRRGLLGAAIGLAMGALGRRDVSSQATAASCGNVICKNNPGKCKAGCVCCVAPNGNSRCTPAGQCSWGQQVCPPERPYVDPARGCVGCVTARQCPTPPDPCGVATCTNGACGVAAAPAGTTCRSASCTGGVATAAATCAVAACPPAVTQVCAPYVCTGAACATACADDAGCAEGFHCVGATCVEEGLEGCGTSGPPCHPECQTCDPEAGVCSNIESSGSRYERVVCGGGNGFCLDGACTLPCGESCVDQCYDRFSVAQEYLGSFCCADHLDANGNCCWIDTKFGIVGDDGVCRPERPRCCNDDCCEAPGQCPCSFGQISRCC